MKKQVSLKELRVIVRRLVENELDAELETVEVGDVVDVDVDEIGTLSVRVLELVDDVNAVSGPRGAEHGPGADFHGPGFVGEIDPASGESGQLVFSMNQVLPGSKMKGYFPKLGDEFDEDEYGRPMNNPYRKGAKRHAAASIARPGDYLPEAAYDKDLDDVMAGFQTSLKSLEDAHPQAPDEESKATIAGLHSDVFNAQAQARPYIRKLKAKAPR